MKRLCKFCNLRPAEMPDRESASERKQVCPQCHRRQLLADIAEIVEAEKRRSL